MDEPQKLDRFLDAVFEKCNLEISIKTRIGMEDPEEFETILPIYNKYPLKELIIHPRVQKEFYKNTPKLDTYAWAVEHSEHPLWGYLFCGGHGTVENKISTDRYCDDGARRAGRSGTWKKAKRRKCRNDRRAKEIP